MTTRKLLAPGLCAAAISLAAYQLFKSGAHARVGAHGPVLAFPGLTIMATSTCGMAFSIGDGAAILVLVGIAVAESGWLFWWLLGARRPAEALGLGLAIGGPLGKLTPHRPLLARLALARVSLRGRRYLYRAGNGVTKIVPMGEPGRKLSDDRR